MTHRGSHMVTGATGLVGSALVLDLLARPGRQVWCLVRARSAAAARTRVHSVLERTARAFGISGTPGLHDAMDRCQVLPGDITREGCGLDPADLPETDVVWHCAASLRYEDEYAPEIHRTNVIGTRNVVGLARRLGAELNHLSSIAVAGTGQGVQDEILPVPDLPVHNHYERSKIAAEFLVADSGLCWRILRLGVVVGHSRTYATPAGSGLYRMADKVLRFHRKQPIDHTWPGGPALRIDPDTGLNLLPVDHAAAHTLRIGLDGDPCTVFHVTNAADTKAGDVYRAVFRAAKLPVPRLVGSYEELSAPGKALYQALVFDMPYAVGTRTFDRTNSSAILGEEDMTLVYTQAMVERLVADYWDDLPALPPA